MKGTEFNMKEFELNMNETELKEKSFNDLKPLKSYC